VAPETHPAKNFLIVIYDPGLYLQIMKSLVAQASVPASNQSNGA
jgi:hypothetical protein